MNLFHLTATTTLQELKKAYYDFALLCHPDNGGTTADMQVVQQSYEEAKRQLEWTETSKEKMDCLIDAMEKGTIRQDAPDTHQPSQPPTLPSLHDIFDDVHHAFHTQCHQTCPDKLIQQMPNDAEQPTTHFLASYEKDPYTTQGYGTYMLERWQTSVQENGAQKCDDYSYTPTVSTQDALPPFPSHENEHDTTNTHSLVPHSAFAPTTGFPVHIDPQQHIHDFTVHDNLFANTPHTTQHSAFPRTDYRLAFRSPAPPAPPAPTLQEDTNHDENV